MVHLDKVGLEMEDPLHAQGKYNADEGNGQGAAKLRRVYPPGISRSLIPMNRHDNRMGI